MIKSSYLIGSIRGMADQTVSDGGPSQTVAATLAGIYLDHQSTAALSLFRQLEIAMAALGIASPVVELQENGKVVISAAGVFSLDWDTALLRTTPGFTGNLSGSASYEAPNDSTLLWIPTTTENPNMAPLGVSGAEVYDWTLVVAPDGTHVSDEYGSPLRTNDLEWRYIPKARFWTSSEAAGELHSFFSEVLLGELFFHYREVIFDSTSTTLVTPLSSGIGPLIRNDTKRQLDMRRSRSLTTVEQAYDFRMKTLVVPEYS